MTRALLVSLLVLAVLLVGCISITTITGSGNVITREEAYTDFDTLEVHNGFKLDVSQDDAFSVAIRTDDNIADLVEVSEQGGKDYLNVRFDAENLGFNAHVFDIEGLSVSPRGNLSTTWGGLKSSLQR